MVETKDKPQDNTSVFCLQSSSSKKEISCDIYRLSELLAQKILSNNAKNRTLGNGRYQETVEKWAADIDKLNRIDKQSIEDIRRVIEWCQSDSFWKGNIVSGAALRKQWDRLLPAANEHKDAVSGKESWR